MFYFLCSIGGIAFGDAILLGGSLILGFLFGGLCGFLGGVFCNGPYIGGLCPVLLGCLCLLV